VQDLQFAVRVLARDRWFTLTAVITLALGIGVTTAVFTFVNAAVLRDLPVDHPDRLMLLATRNNAGQEFSVSYPDHWDWRDGTRAFTGIAAYVETIMILGDEEKVTERFQGTYITANAFHVIGQAPMLGRDLLLEDEQPGATPVVILGSDVWKSRYGGDPALVGRKIRVNDTPTVVVGIMPEGFRFPYMADGWEPLSHLPGLANQRRDARTLNVYGRLRDDVTLTQARAELSTIAERLARDHPDTNRNIQPTVVTLGDAFHGSLLKVMFLTLMGAGTFVLLIACANVGNLLLARSASRSREIAIRTSLGATRWLIVRQLLIECLLFASLAGILGFALSVYAVQLFAVAIEQSIAMPFWLHFTMDVRVFAFVATVSLLTSVVCGLAPALHLSKADLNDVLKDGGRTSTFGVRARRWTGALLIVELASTLVLLAGAGFMLRSFLVLYRAGDLIDTTGLMTMRITMPIQKYRTAEQRKDFVDQLERTVTSIPGVVSAAVANQVPFASGDQRQLLIDGRPVTAGESLPQVSYIYVGPSYFRTLNLRLTRGRDFTAEDGRVGHESAIVNQRFAGMFFAAGDPIGRRIRLTAVTPAAFTASPSGTTAAAAWVTIVGVSPTVPQRFGDAPDPVVYVPYRGEPEPVRSAALIVRGQIDAAVLMGPIREEVRRLEPALPLYGIRRMDQVLATSRWPQRIFGTMLSVLAFIALLLASVGLYAVTAHGVAQRTHEIGVRMALGAQHGQVIWLFLKHMVVQLGIGLTVGLAGALGVGRLLQSFLIQTGTRDPITLVGVSAILVVVTIAACVFPARHAALVDPVVALRHE
jgi:putative ABC transport system permease protein